MDDVRLMESCRITKLMGESFKLHSQALVGYEDAIASCSGSSTPGMSSPSEELDMDDNSGF
jgi:hypothetical protein